MKKPFIALIIILLSLSNVISQGELNVVDPQNEWIYSDRAFSSPVGDLIRTRILDSIVYVDNELSFYPMQTNLTDNEEDWSIPGGGIAQSNGKVYRIVDGNTNEYHLLYDFNLEVGDSIKNYYFFEDLTLEVIKIDTIQYQDNLNRKKLHLVTKGYEMYPEAEIIWVEGLGAEVFPLWWYAYPNTYESIRKLECFKKNELPIYVPGNQCLITSVKNLQTNSVNVYPNPIIDKVTLESNSKIVKSEIYTILGNHLKTYYEESFDVSTLSKGTYVLCIYFKSNLKLNRTIIKL